MIFKTLLNSCLFFLIAPSTAMARNYLNCEDMGYEDCGSGDLGLFGAILVMAIGLIAVISFFTNKGFRKGLIFYAAHMLGFAFLGGLLFKEFDKETGVFIFLGVTFFYIKFVMGKAYNLFFEEKQRVDSKSVNGKLSTPPLSSHSNVTRSSATQDGRTTPTPTAHNPANNAPAGTSTRSVSTPAKEPAAPAEKWKFNGLCLERGISSIPLTSLKRVGDGFEVKDYRYPNTVWIRKQEIDCNFEDICKLVDRQSGW